MNHPFLNARKFLPFAHRGENYLKPENTFEAFKTAVDMGYSHIETDVRASKEYRSDMIGVMTKRSLLNTIAQLKESLK